MPEAILRPIVDITKPKFNTSEYKNYSVSKSNCGCFLMCVSGFGYSTDIRKYQLYGFMKSIRKHLIVDEVPDPDWPHIKIKDTNPLGSKSFVWSTTNIQDGPEIAEWLKEQNLGQVLITDPVPNVLYPKMEKKTLQTFVFVPDPIAVRAFYKKFDEETKSS